MGKVTVDDAFVAAVEFENGAIGTVEASRFAAGRKNHNVFEINGEKGLDQIQPGAHERARGVLGRRASPKKPRASTNVLVSEAYHPWWSNWWPQGHMIGWEHTFVHEIHHLLDCIVNDKDVAPFGADFEDGYRAAVICDGILESAATKKQVDLKY
jgi:predicted dehydrogenase